MFHANRVKNKWNIKNIQDQVIHSEYFQNPTASWLKFPRDFYLDNPWRSQVWSRTFMDTFMEHQASSWALRVVETSLVWALSLSEGRWTRLFLLQHSDRYRGHEEHFQDQCSRKRLPQICGVPSHLVWTLCPCKGQLGQFDKEGCGGNEDEIILKSIQELYCQEHRASQEHQASFRLQA